MTNKIISNKPIIKPFADFIKIYVTTNKHRMINGFLFPYNKRPDKYPHMQPHWAQSAFCKIRKKIGEKYPEFLDKYFYNLPRGGMVKYRISSHALRRWFETNVYLMFKDPYLIKEIMGYDDIRTVDHYISSYEFFKREPKVLHATFNDLFLELQNLPPTQKKLDEFNSA